MFKISRGSGRGVKRSLKKMRWHTPKSKCRHRRRERKIARPPFPSTSPSGATRPTARSRPPRKQSCISFKILSGSSPNKVPRANIRRAPGKKILPPPARRTWTTCSEISSPNSTSRTTCGGSDSSRKRPTSTKVCKMRTRTWLRKRSQKRFNAPSNPLSRRTRRQPKTRPPSRL